MDKYSKNIYYDQLEEYVGTPMKYKELCAVLGENVYDRKAKELQLKRLCQYFEIERKSANITITRLYTNDEIRLIESQGKYTTYIENTLIKILKEEKDNKVSYSYRELLEKLLMINDKFYDGKYHRSKYFDSFLDEGGEPYITPEDKHRITATSMNLFFGAGTKLLKTIIDGALKSMERRSLITANKNFRLYRKTFFVNNDGTTMTCVETKDCDDIEHSIVLDIREQTMAKFTEGQLKLKEINPNHKPKIVTEWRHLHMLSNEERNLFFASLNSTIFERLGYDNYGDIYDIHIGKQGIESQYNDLLRLESLNKNVQDRLLSYKDLNIINEIMKKGLVDKFIKVEKNHP